MPEVFDKPNATFSEMFYKNEMFEMIENFQKYSINSEQIYENNDDYISLGQRSFGQNSHPPHCCSENSKKRF
jgi:hypothetical protein